MAKKLYSICWLTNPGVQFGYFGALLIAEAPFFYWACSVPLTAAGNFITVLVNLLQGCVEDAVTGSRFCWDVVIRSVGRNLKREKLEENMNI